MKKLLSVLMFIQLALVSVAQNIQTSKGPAQESSVENPWDIYVILGASFVVAAFSILIVLVVTEWQKELKASRRRHSAAKSRGD